MSSGLSKSLDDVFFEQDYTDLKALPSTKQREREEGGTPSPEAEREWNADSPSPSPVRGQVGVACVGVSLGETVD